MLVCYQLHCRPEIHFLFSNKIAACLILWSSSMENPPGQQFWSRESSKQGNWTSSIVQYKICLLICLLSLFLLRTNFRQKHGQAGCTLYDCVLALKQHPPKNCFCNVLFLAFVKLVRKCYYLAQSECILTFLIVCWKWNSKFKGRTILNQNALLQG